MLTVMGVEWRRLWRNRLARVGLLAFLIIPLLYSSLYLCAFWDPYGRLDKLPVAVVNEDTGGTQDGKVVHFGSDVERALVDNRTLNWHKTSKADALDGVKTGKYYMVLDIPSTFSADLLSVNTSHPHKADLSFIPNQGANYLAGQITARVQNEIAAGLAQRFSKQYISRLLDVVGQSSTGLSTIAKTAAELANGGQQVKSGAVQLAASMNTANQGATQLDNALHKLTPGSQQLASGLQGVQQGTLQVQQGVVKSRDGITQIRNQLAPIASPSGQLATGTSQAADAAQQLTDSSQQLLDSINQIVSGVQQLQAGLQSEQSVAQQAQSGVSQAEGLLQSYQQANGNAADTRVVQALAALEQTSPGLDALSAGIAQSNSSIQSLSSALAQIQSGQNTFVSNMKQLTANLRQVSGGMSQFNQSLQPLDSALSQIQTGLTSAANGLGQVNSAQQHLQTGAAQLNDGLNQSAAGSRTLSSGMKQLVSGSQSLANGATKTADGQQAFAGKVASAKQVSTVDNPSGLADVMSSPIHVSSNVIYPVKEYGTGLAPYFMPLSLWVGALMLFFLISFREGRWRVTPIAGHTVVLGKLGVLWSIGAVQAVVTSTVLLAALKLSVTSVTWFYLFNILISVMSVTVIALFIKLFGSGAGRFIAIVLLLLQLTSSGGTFPVELVPGFFRGLHPVLPMSYGVEGLRNIIAINNRHDLWQSVGMLGVYFAGALILLTVIQRKEVRPGELKVPDHLVS